MNNPIVDNHNPTKRKFVITNYVIRLVGNDDKNYNLFELFILNCMYDIVTVIMLNSNPLFCIEDRKIFRTDDLGYLNADNICINLEQVNTTTGVAKYLEIVYFKE